MQFRYICCKITLCKKSVSAYSLRKRGSHYSRNRATSEIKKKIAEDTVCFVYWRFRSFPLNRVLI